MEEILRKTELLTSKVKERSGTNSSNILDKAIQEEGEEECNECFNECSYGEVLDLRRKIKQGLSLEQTKKRKFTVRYHHGKLNVLPYNYQFPLMT